MKARGINTRIALVVAGMVIITAVASATLILAQLDDVLIDAASEVLERDTDIQGTEFTTKINEMVRDVKVMAGVPPIQGIIRAGRNGGVDPMDGSSFEIWRQRLQVIYSELAKHKPSYLQVRFIGVDDGGRELIRVNRLPDDRGIEVVAPADLQRKQGETYFQDATRLPPGRVYLSDINLNREQGAIQRPPTPVLRAATPVHDAQGQIFGIVVINLAMQQPLAEIGNVVNQSWQHYVANEEGAFLAHPEPAMAFAFEFGETTGLQAAFPEFSQIQSGQADVITRIDTSERRVYSLRRVAYGPPELERWMVIGFSDHFDDITRITRQVIRQVLILMLVLVAAAVLVAIAMGRRITAPITRLTSSVRSMDLATGQLDLPTTLDHEAGELAKALGETFEALLRRTEELERNNRELEQFAYIASHDLQEPLRTVSSFSELLQKRYGEQLDDRGRKSLAFIFDSCQRMQALVHGLLEFSRLGKQAKPETVDLAALIEEVRHDLGAALSEQGARILVGDLPTLRVLRMEVRLLFQNLIGNAIKFSRPGVPGRCGSSRCPTTGSVSHRSTGRRSS